MLSENAPTSALKQTQQQFENQLNRQSVVSNVKSIKSKEDERKGRRDESQDEGVAVQC